MRGVSVIRCLHACFSRLNLIGIMILLRGRLVARFFQLNEFGAYFGTRNRTIAGLRERYSRNDQNSSQYCADKVFHNKQTSRNVAPVTMIEARGSSP
jgi:hypothetical protein